MRKNKIEGNEINFDFQNFQTFSKQLFPVLAKV